MCLKPRAAEPLTVHQSDASRVVCLWIKGGSKPTCTCFMPEPKEAICPQIKMQDSAYESSYRLKLDTEKGEARNKGVCFFHILPFMSITCSTVVNEHFNELVLSFKRFDYLKDATKPFTFLGICVSN